ncbi:OmpA family protein, partial [Campylobacter upsaliensis]
TTQAVKTESQNTEKHAGASRTPNDEVEALKRLTLSQQETIRKLKAALDQSENQIALNLPSRVEFAKNSAEIVSADVQDYLKRMAQLSLSLPPQAKIEIRGFTDNSDSALRSFELGYERAKAVMNYFIDGGVSVGKLSIKSYGF